MRIRTLLLAGVVAGVAAGIVVGVRNACVRRARQDAAVQTEDAAARPERDADRRAPSPERRILDMIAGLPTAFDASGRRAFDLGDAILTALGDVQDDGLRTTLMLRYMEALKSASFFHGSVSRCMGVLDNHEQMLLFLSLTLRTVRCPPEQIVDLYATAVRLYENELQSIDKRPEEEREPAPPATRSPKGRRSPSRGRYAFSRADVRRGYAHALRYAQRSVIAYLRDCLAAQPDAWLDKDARPRLNAMVERLAADLSPSP